jgi:hypothetical protein
MTLEKAGKLAKDQYKYLKEKGAINIKTKIVGEGPDGYGVDLVYEIPPDYEYFGPTWGKE